MHDGAFHITFTEPFNQAISPKSIATRFYLVLCDIGACFVSLISSTPKIAPVKMSPIFRRRGYIIKSHRKP